MILLKYQTELKNTTHEQDTVIQTGKYLDHPISAPLHKYPENFHHTDEVA